MFLGFRWEIRVFVGNLIVSSVVGKFLTCLFFAGKLIVSTDFFFFSSVTYFDDTGAKWDHVMRNKTATKWSIIIVITLVFKSLMISFRLLYDILKLVLLQQSFFSFDYLIFLFQIKKLMGDMMINLFGPCFWFNRDR